MKFKLKYPKFTLVVLSFLTAYLFFLGRDFLHLHSILSHLDYVGLFLVGSLFTYCFTSGPATVLLIILAKDYNLFLAAFIAGLGAMVGDLIIFRFIKSSFKEEIDKLRKEKFVRIIHDIIPNKIRKYVLLLFGGLVIASPLPDELGVLLMASYSNISTKLFLLISYLFNTIGILIVLYIGQII